jgi:hypothetical protein
MFFFQLQRLSTIVPMGHIPPHSPEAVARASDYMIDIDSRLRRYFQGVRAIAFTVQRSPEASDKSGHQ